MKFVILWVAVAVALVVPQTILTRYTEYTSLPYFAQSLSTTDDYTFNVTEEVDFGLLSGYSWEYIQTLLAQGSHKLLFLQRHAEGYHNIAPAKYNSSSWSCYWQVRDGDDSIEWYDAQLTRRGVQQTDAMSQAWRKAITNGVPIPHKFYVSPLRRTLETWHLLWSGLTSQVPVVKEMARETYGIGTESKRHSKRYLESRFPTIEFEAGFSEDDLLWQSNLHESLEHRGYRAKLLLDDIFKTNDQIVSVITHSGLVKSLLSVVGHRKWLLGTGQMIPVLVAGETTDRDYEWKDHPWRRYSDTCPVNS